MINRVILVGRLGADPKTTRTANGSTCVQASLATDEPAANGEKRAAWHKLIAWQQKGKQGGASAALAACGVGDLVYVEGRLQYRQWEDRDGNTRTLSQVLVWTVLRLQKRGRDDSSEESDVIESEQPEERPAARNRARRVARAPEAAPDEPPDDDLPF
jgi:single-strand DNA-binding protein